MPIMICLKLFRATCCDLNLFPLSPSIGIPPIFRLRRSSGAPSFPRCRLFDLQQVRGPANGGVAAKHDSRKPMGHRAEVEPWREGAGMIA